ncbi:hypothetical protein B0H14DRAFT_3153210 [Mycena olivaceomarginata]|nr:hypothetical protein B0H14DRAFT_3153210 [Mycena olivaceomarginata]
MQTEFAIRAHPIYHECIISTLRGAAPPYLMWRRVGFRGLELKLGDWDTEAHRNENILWRPQIELRDLSGDRGGDARRHRRVIITRTWVQMRAGGRADASEDLKFRFPDPAQRMVPNRNSRNIPDARRCGSEDAEMLLKAACCGHGFRAPDVIHEFEPLSAQLQTNVPTVILFRSVPIRATALNLFRVVEYLVEDRYQCEAKKPRIYIYPVLITRTETGTNPRRVVAAFWIFLCPEASTPRSGFGVLSCPKTGAVMGCFRSLPSRCEFLGGGFLGHDLGGQDGSWSDLLRWMMIWVAMDNWESVPVVGHMSG